MRVVVTGGAVSSVLICVMFSSPEATRSFCYVDDLVRGLSR